MEIDTQLVFNIAIALSGFFGGWVLNSLTKAIDRLDKDVREMPRIYVSRDDFKEALKDIKCSVNTGFLKVDKTLSEINNKLDRKEDKR